jgi:putative flippase GtrA
MGDEVEIAQESVAKSSPAERAGFRQKIVSLDERYGIFKLAKFAVATGTGFLIAEAILTLGLFSLYGQFSAPSNAYSSLTFLAVDIAALAIGVAVSFFLNERFTLRVSDDDDNSRHPAGASSRIHIRLLKFEAVNAMGNVTIMLVQLALLFMLSITPVVGNMIGAIVSYPVTYLVSMHFVWGSGAGRLTGFQQTLRRSQELQKAVPLHQSPPLTEITVFVALFVISRALARKKH